MLIRGRTCGLEYNISSIARLERLIVLVLLSLRIFGPKCLVTLQCQAFRRQLPHIKSEVYLGAVRDFSQESLVVMFVTWQTPIC